MEPKTDMEKTKERWDITKKYLKKAAKFTRDKLILIRPLSKREEFQLSKVNPYLSPKELKLLVSFIKQKKASINLNRLGWSFLISGKDLLPELISDAKEIQELNEKIQKIFYKERFEEFSERAFGILPQLIAPNLVGLLHAKQAAALQLFSTEPIHILLLGDPGTGKTEIIRSAAELAPISSFGLGSGTSGAGLSATVEGKKILPGLLPMAHNGICCIDELNLMKKEDRASLYNAMEKGFVSYDKGGKHYKFDAKIKLLSTANPEGDKFKSYKLEAIKEQLPFDSALLSRFHLILFIKKVSLEKFADIAEKLILNDKSLINKADISFIKKYIAYASNLDAKLPHHLSSKVKEFVMELKKNEDNLPFEITPRTIHGVLRLAKASALMELREEIEPKDLDRVFNIFNKQL